MADVLDSLRPVTLIVKAPNQRVEDKRIACELSWTVAQLKEHLSSVYPEKPEKHQQKLVYFGKLLKDESCLHEVLTQECYGDAHTVHLVCPSKLTQKENTNPTSTRFASNHQPQVLRQRRRFAAPSTSPRQNNTYNEDQYQMYYNWMNSQFAPSQASRPDLTPQQRLWLQVYRQQAAMYSYQMSHMAPWLNEASINPNSPFNSSTVPHQDTSGETETPTTPEAGGEPAVQEEEPAQRAEVNDDGADDNMVMNAQGGLDNAADIQNDWLDTLYTFTRFGMLLMLLYFYTTFGRFSVVFAVGLFFYLAQGNFFQLRRRRAHQPAPAHPPQNEQNQAENQNNENNERDIGRENPAEVNNNGPNARQATENQNSWIDGFKVVCTFVITFFSSLIPQNPAAVQN